MNRRRHPALCWVIGLLTTCLVVPPCLGDVPARSGHASEPVESAAQAIQPDVWGLRRQAEELVRTGKIMEALALYDQIVARDADHAPSLRKRADLNAKVGNLEAAVADYRRVLAIWPREADVHGSLGWTLLKMGRFADAQPHCEDAHRLYPLNMATAANLGHAHLLQGDAQTARRFYQETLTLVLDKDELKTGPLADFDLFLEKGWEREAVGRARQWMTLAYAEYAPHRLALSAWDTASTLERAGRHDEAVTQYRSVIDLFEKAFGHEHPATGGMLINLAGLYESMGQYARAEPLYQRALAIAEKVLGPEHPLTGTYTNNLAVLYESMGQYARAEPLYQRALAVRERALGTEHADTGTSFNNLAELYESMGQYARAEPLYQRALAIAEKVLGPEHPLTGTFTNNLAVLYESMGQYARAEPLYQRALAVRERALGTEHADTGTSFNNLAGLYKSMGQYARAEPLYQRALAIAEKVLGPEHPLTGTFTNNLAVLYESMGQYARAEPLYQRALAVRERALGTEHADTGTSFNNLAGLYKSMGQYARAEPLYQRALAIAEKVLGPEHPLTGTFTNNLAVLYESMGQYARAEPLYQRALAVRERALGTEHADTGTSFNNLAGLYKSMGQYARAEPLYQRALAIAEKVLGPEHPLTGTFTNNLAVLYESIGQYARAEPLYQRALAVRERALGTEHADTGTSFNNLAGLYKSMGQYARAEPLYQRALAIAEKVLGPEHPLTGTFTNNLAALYDDMGQYARAEPLYARALAIAEKAEGPEHPSTGTSLNNLALLYYAMGQYARAEPLFVRALLIAQHAGDPQLLRYVQESLSVLLDKQSNPEAAIFFGKQAVNTLQGLRANVAGLGKDTLKDFDSGIEGTYRHLSRLLIAQGRLIEAERVLELLKEQEQFQYVRRDASVSDLTGKAPLTAFETTQAQALDQASAPLAPLHAELKALRSKSQRTPDETARLATLRQQIDAASQTFQQALTQVIATLGATRQDKIDDLKEAQGLQNTLRELSRLTGDKVVLLYTVTDKESYSLILTTPDYRRAYTVPVGAQELNDKIAAWRATLKNPRLDPRPQAKELLDIVLPPDARAELAQFKAGSLMWHLDGALRLLPLAALHDGEHYLIERYRLTTFTAASRDHLKDQPLAQWQGLGLGVSEARQVGDKNFPALASVPEELATVIRQGQGQVNESGVIPGQRYLNPAFNWDTLQAQLEDKGKYPLVHIASHFSLEPGNDTMSYLLPGAGEPITLALLTRQDNLFGGVDLLTLSACETGVGGGRGNDGVEVDGLSFIAQRQGAKAVLASLWPVADESTAKLMRRFYQLRQDKQLSKAEALRQAQVEFIRTAQAGQTGQGDDRGAARVRVEGQAAQTTTDLGWAHPYYWAPFVLMGNWL